MIGHWLISGANRGIGRELARQLVARGDRVTATVRDKATRARVAAETAAHGERFAALAFDMRDEAAIHAAAKDFSAPLDVLVANAGVVGPERQSVLDTDFDGVLDTFSINTLGPLRLVQAFLPALRRARNPRVVVVSSRLGSMSLTGFGNIAYCASKAALNKIAQVLASDLRPLGVTVISLHPGWVRTDMGGANADLSVEESVVGIISVIDALSLDETGRFLDYRGVELPW